MAGGRCVLWVMMRLLTLLAVSAKTHIYAQPLAVQAGINPAQVAGSRISDRWPVIRSPGSPARRQGLLPEGFRPLPRTVLIDGSSLERAAGTVHEPAASSTRMNEITDPGVPVRRTGRSGRNSNFRAGLAPQIAGTCRRAHTDARRPNAVIRRRRVVDRTDGSPRTHRPPHPPNPRFPR